jgi:hypothetical protein
VRSRLGTQRPDAATDRLGGSGAGRQSSPRSLVSMQTRFPPMRSAPWDPAWRPCPANSQRIKSRWCANDRKVMMTWLGRILIAATMCRKQSDRVGGGALYRWSSLRLAWGNSGISQASETCNRSRSAINPGPVGCHPSFLRVCALEAGTSSPTNIASQPK